MEMGPNRPPYERTTPTKQWNPFSGASSADVPPPSSSRKSSILSAGQPEASPSSSRKSSILSYSQPFGAAVDFKHSAPPCPDEIIFVAVRLSSPFRSKSLEPCDELPSRYSHQSAIVNSIDADHGHQTTTSLVPEAPDNPLARVRERGHVQSHQDASRRLQALLHARQARELHWHGAGEAVE